MDKLALKIANKLKVCVFDTHTRLLQNTQYLLGNAQSKPKLPQPVERLI